MEHEEQQSVPAPPQANVRLLNTRKELQMTKVVVFTNLTLDGVMQAPGRPDEDRRGGFEHGGWATPYADSVIGSMAGESMAYTGALLLGRRTYEDFYAFWLRIPAKTISHSG